MFGGQSWDMSASGEWVIAFFSYLREILSTFHPQKLDFDYFSLFTFVFPTTKMFFPSCFSDHVIPTLETLQYLRNTLEGP